MSTSIEQRLVSRIVADRDINHAINAGVRQEFFLDAKTRQVFDALIRHKGKYGEVPSLTVIKQDFPDYIFVKPKDSMEYLIDEIKRLHALSILEQGLNAGVNAYDSGQPDSVSKVLQQTLRKIATDIPTGRDINVTETGAERLERYRALRDLPDGLRGIPTGFPTIDRATQGLQAEQLVTFVGPPKSGKSTMLLLAAMSAWATGHRPLFIGFEMSNEEQEERLDAFRAHISHTRLRGGQLTKDEMTRLEKAVRQMEAMPDFFLSSDIMSATTLSGVQAKIENIEPDVVFIDGVYMMDDELGEPKGSPQALTNITRGAKRLAQQARLPLCVSTQVLESKMDKKRGVTSASVGYSSSFGQDSDVMFATQNTEDPEVKMLKVLLSRNCPPLEAFSRWDWEHGTFEEIEDPWAIEGEGGF